VVGALGSRTRSSEATMGLKDELGETGIGGGYIWAKGPALDYVSPWEEKRKPIHTACENGKPDEVASILEAEPEMLNIQDLGGNTPLHIAARAPTDKETTPGRLECAKLLISKGAGIDTLDMHGDSPLTLAAMSEPAGSTDASGIVKILVDAKADLTVQEVHYRMTALHWAANGGKTKVIKELLAHPDAKEVKMMKDKSGATPKELATNAKKNADAAAALL